jgi:hypothetical protein
MQKRLRIEWPIRGTIGSEFGVHFRQLWYCGLRAPLGRNIAQFDTDGSL